MTTVFKTGEARAALSEILNSASAAHAPVIERGAQQFVVTQKSSLLSFLKHTVNLQPLVVQEDDAYVVLIPGLPFASEAAGIDEALDRLVDDLKEYADQWEQEFSSAPNHADNWGLVTLVSLLSPAELTEWLMNG